MYIHYCRKIAIFLCYYELQITVSQIEMCAPLIQLYYIYIYIYIYNIKYCTHYFKSKFTYCNL